MPSALSSLNTFSVPLSSRRRPLSHGCWRAKAMVFERGDSLDHLQRASEQQHQPPSPPPWRRTAPSSPVGLWDRFPTTRTMQQIMETMDRIIEDPFAYSTGSFPSLSGEDSMRSYRRTPWEIKKGEMEYKMRFDMPGMTKKDVKVWVEDRMLVIKAQKVHNEGKEREEEEGWFAMSYERYNSRIALPDNVVVEKIKVEVKDSVLYITIPTISPSSKALCIDV